MNSRPQGAAKRGRPDVVVCDIGLPGMAGFASALRADPETATARRAYRPRKHTIVLKPAERWSVAITADVAGRWAFHCHLLLHMEMGMFRVVEVS